MQATAIDIANETDRRPCEPFITRGYLTGFVLVTSLFFLWAIANNLNDILIRQFQKALALNRMQAGLIQFAFYLGYFLVAPLAGLLLRRLGYRAGILAGLLLYAGGAALFYPAAELRVYAAFLGALFVLASGAAFLETAANPYIVAFGDPGRAAQRLNLAQAFNGLGASIAPAIGGAFIFSGIEYTNTQLAALSPEQLDVYRASEAHMVQTPYLALAGIVILLAIAIAVVRLPPVEPDRPAVVPAFGGGSLLRVRSFTSGVVAQFFYVGAQVGIWSFFVDFVKHMSPQTPERTAAYLLSASLVLFMAGRFIGTAMMSFVRPERLLTIYAIANVFLCAVAALSGGWAAIGALMLTSFFMSIMFPTIFSIGLRDLGDRAMIGASVLIMAIIGGAVLPPLIGLVSQYVTIQAAMLLPLVCFVVIAGFGETSRRPR